MTVDYDIVCCSSESSVHAAENIKNTDLYRTWQTNEPQTKATITLALETPIHIKNIEIGNAGSAFIEVLVSDSTSGKKGEEDDNVLVTSQAMMSSSEAKANTNRSRIRTFTQFNSNAAENKWDRVKIICTNPFNMKTPIGLAFVRINLNSQQLNEFSKSEATPTSPKSASSSSSTTTSPPKHKHPPTTSTSTSTSTSSSSSSSNAELSSFLKNNSDDEDGDVKPGRLFYSNGKKEREQNIEPVTKTEKGSRSKEDLKKDESRKPLQVTTTKSNNNSNKATDATKKKPKPLDESHSDAGSSDDEKRDHSKKPPVKKAKSKPLSGVVFVLSGFVNPERSNIRDMVAELGAEYRNDWDDDCTHLIAAYGNTPKIAEVKKRRKGYIVSKEWVEECYDGWKRLPEKNYRLDPSSSSSSSSRGRRTRDKSPIVDPFDDRPDDPDDDDFVPSTSTSQKKRSPSPSPKSKTSKTVKGKSGQKGNDDDDTDSMDDDATKEAFGRFSSSKRKTANVSSSEDENDSPLKKRAKAKSNVFEEDTDEESNSKNNANDKNNSAYECDTEEDEDLKIPAIASEGQNERSSPTPPTTPSKSTSSLRALSHGDSLNSLPNFFSGFKFYLHDVSDSKKRLLRRSIVAYNGVLDDKFSDRTTHVLSDSPGWKSAYDSMTSKNPHVKFVQTKWVEKCSKQKKLVPDDLYVV